MARVENKPLSADPTLMANIQSEVAQESRPLLQFITSNAKYLVAIIVLLIVALLATAIYRQVVAGQQEETLETLAQIMQRPSDDRQIADLEALAKECPSSMRTAVAVALVQSAAAQNKAEKAAEGYAEVARTEFDTPFGLAAALNQAGELMSAGKYADGVKVLQGLLPRLTDQTGQQAKMMLAEGAARAGDYELAARTYEDLAAAVQIEVEKDYCATRARDLRARAQAEKDAARADGK